MKTNSPMPYLLAIPALFTAFLHSGCVCTESGPATQWFRGNTHAHTTRSDGNSAPEVVAKWYLDHDYNFLILSDHNKFVDPKEVKLPKERREDFLLIPGEEVSGREVIHTTAMNITKVVPWKQGNKPTTPPSPWTESDEKTSIIQFHVDGTREAGGQAILNHPNFHYAVSAKEILPIKNLYMFELFNGHPGVNIAGDHKEHPSTEEMWDQLLTKGMLMYGVSSDDAHHFKAMKKTSSNPGRGWVMVQAASLEPDSITEAMMQGDFYASNGVFLKTCKRGAHTYVIEVDTGKTQEELSALPELRGMHVGQGTLGFRIEFIGPRGIILDTIKGKKGRFKINHSIPYVRAKATFTRLHPETQEIEEYYAWGQPFFTDARATMEIPHADEHAKADTGKTR